MNPPDTNAKKSTTAYRVAAAACLLGGLALCAYAGGRAQRRPAGAALAAKPAPRAAAQRGGVTLTKIKGTAATGKAAAAGPSANVGQKITLTGTGFNDNVSVQFTAFANSTFSVAPLSVKNKKVMVAVPAQVVTGGVRLIDPVNGTSDPLKLQIVPTIDTLTPDSGAPGSRLLIDGAGFTHDAKVKFKGVTDPVTPTVVSPSRIDILIPAGAQTGKIQVVTDGGTSKPAKLTVAGSKAEPEPTARRTVRRAVARRR